MDNKNACWEVSLTSVFDCLKYIYEFTNVGIVDDFENLQMLHFVFPAPKIFQNEVVFYKKAAFLSFNCNY